MHAHDEHQERALSCASVSVANWVRKDKGWSSCVNSPKLGQRKIPLQYGQSDQHAGKYMVESWGGGEVRC